MSKSETMWNNVEVVARIHGLRSPNLALDQIKRLGEVVEQTVKRIGWYKIVLAEERGEAEKVHQDFVILFDHLEKCLERSINLEAMA